MGPPSDQLDPSKPADRALLRRRADSDAWHNTFKQEFAKNEDEDKSKELARAAARKAREEFDRKYPKQPATPKAKAKAKARPEPKAKVQAKPKANKKVFQPYEVPHGINPARVSECFIQHLETLSSIR